MKYLLKLTVIGNLFAFLGTAQAVDGIYDTNAIASLLALECSSQRTHVVSISNSETFHEAKVKEAQAMVDYVRARIQTTQWVLSKSQLDVKFNKPLLERYERLYKKKAISLNELERVQRKMQQSELDVRLVGARINELQTELKAAEARLEQAQAAAQEAQDAQTGETDPPEEGKNV